ncbi:hypothetical protein RZE82_07815 [Mollicutes bacterium LVI A0039]|nr:hypothetical protein RZE82_07815 [Mollicutes bacterium LVI A0039]
MNIKSKIKEMNKKKVGAIAVVLLLLFAIAVNNFISNKQEWTKNSGHADNTFVTSNELETQKQKVYDESQQLIIDTISNENVVKQLDYLSKQKLNEEQQQILSNILTVHTSFDETKDYTLDEIISLATDYSKLVTDIESLFTEVKATELTTSINDLEKKIQEHQKGISKLALTSGEQTELDKHVKSYKDVKFNKDTTYTIDELELIKTKFTDVNKQFDSLSKKVKDRIAKEQTEAEKQQAQATIYNQSSGYNEGNYTGNTNTSTSNTNNSNTSNAGVVSNQVKPSECQYTSLEAAIQVGEASGRGYHAFVCGKYDGITWYQLSLFDGDNTGETDGWMGWEL